ncbi:hypothetical protein MANES_14G145400v8 [Manihot esculenta]|uniref:Uncharacterized protein n=1 Tax=Manihot esculenta TaxID=3983 RepID=A0ACB7GIX3_MANES|nr:hypothetical protein MANES_14G145400v8 [Manihot esculenta]
MKRETLAWLLFIICCQALSYCACEVAFIPHHNSPMTRPKQLMVHKSMAEPKSKPYQKILERRGLHEVDAKNFQKLAKGVYGGTDNLRPRSKSKSGATSLLLNSSAFFSAVLGLIVFVVFF